MNAFFPLSEPTSKAGERSQAFTVELFWSQMCLALVWEWGTWHVHPISLLSQARCGVVNPGAWCDTLLPPWKFSAGNLQAAWGCPLLPGQCKLGRPCPTWAPSHLLGLAWETSLRRAARRSAAGQRSSCSPVCFIFKLHRSLPGMKQCCVSAPMQTSLHSFYLTGEIKIIPDINQLCSASEHNLNTFSWLLSPLCKSSKFPFWPSHSSSRKWLMRGPAIARQRCHWEGTQVTSPRKRWQEAGRSESLLNISFPMIIGPKHGLNLGK